MPVAPAKAKKPTPAKTTTGVLSPEELSKMVKPGIEVVFTG